MKKILVVSTITPFPPDRGHRIRIYYLLNQLLTEFRVGLVTMVFSPEEYANARMLKDVLPEIDPMVIVRSAAHRSMVTRLRASCGSRLSELAGFSREKRYHSPLELRRAVRGAAEAFGPELIQVHYWFAREAVPDSQSAQIWTDSIDIHWRREWALVRAARTPIQRAILRRRARLVMEQELLAYRSCQRVLAVHEEERRILAEQIKPIPVTTIPISLAVPGRPLRRQPAKTAVFVGALDYAPNRDAVRYIAREIFPLVRKREPDAELRVVGLMRRRAQLPREPWITYTGYVPQLDDALGDVAVAIAPLRLGAGTNVKVLSLLGRGLPLVATRRAIEGLGLQDGQEVVSSEDPAVMAEAIIQLMRDQDEATRLGEAAHAFALKRFHWETTAPDVARLYRNGFEEVRFRIESHQNESYAKEL